MSHEILNFITNTVCQTLNENAVEICGKTKTDRFVLVRNIIGLIAFDDFGISYSDISRYLIRNHSTIIHNLNKFRSDLQLYKGPQWEYIKAKNQVLIASNTDIYQLKNNS